jgi:hypothetical protein
MAVNIGSQSHLVEDRHLTRLLAQMGKETNQQA